MKMKDENFYRELIEKQKRLNEEVEIEFSGDVEINVEIDLGNEEESEEEETENFEEVMDSVDVPLEFGDERSEWIQQEYQESLTKRETLVTELAKLDEKIGLYESVLENLKKLYS